MSSQTDIINLALVLLGDNTVVSIDDPTTNARTMKAIYDTVRRDELRSHYWKFALFKSQVASVATPVAPTPYQFTFQMPDDCLRLVDAGNTRQNLGMLNYRTGLEKLYDWQGNFIFTQMPGPLWIHYVKDARDTSQFDANFVTSFACKIAQAASYKLTQSTQVWKKLQTEYNQAILRATMNNAIERLPEGLADDSWVISRL